MRFHYKASNTSNLFLLVFLGISTLRGFLLTNYSRLINGSFRVSCFFYSSSGFLKIFVSFGIGFLSSTICSASLLSFIFLILNSQPLVPLI